MLAPSISLEEAERLKDLVKAKILETPIQEEFERITRLAKRLFNVPIVAISLVEDRRQWFKSIQGLDVSETCREVSFCGHAILQEGVLIGVQRRNPRKYVVASGDPQYRRRLEEGHF